MSKDTLQQPTPKEIHLTPEEIGGLIELESVEKIEKGHDIESLMMKLLDFMKIPNVNRADLMKRWNWSISSDAKYVDMQLDSSKMLTQDFFDLDNDLIDFNPATTGMGIQNLINSIGTNKIISIKNGDRWLLEIVNKQPKETKNNLSGGQSVDPSDPKRKPTIRIVQPDPNIPNSMVFKKKKPDSPTGGSNFALDA